MAKPKKKNSPYQKAHKALFNVFDTIDGICADIEDLHAYVTNGSTGETWSLVTDEKTRAKVHARAIKNLQKVIIDLSKALDAVQEA